MSIQLRDGLANQPADHILEDLLVRFVINCPDEDLSSIERVFFQVEEAQWFYTDFIRQLNPSLPSMKMKTFAPRLLSKCPLLWKWGDPADSLSRFGKYKRTIPVRGIALINKDMTKVVLVQGTELSLWSFPRGKISKDESDLVCAVREVKEETGFDAKDYVNEKDVLERTVHGKNFKIYLARNVPEDYHFEPLVRNEIALIRWYDIKALQKSVKQNPNKFFIVDPFMKPLNRWINRKKGVVNEEELMRQAEVKLKEMMGISAVPTDSADAGRELLNILQGVAGNPGFAAPANANGSPGAQTQPPQYIQMTVPQHLQSFYAGMGQMLQSFPHTHPNGFVPMQNPLRPPQFNGGFNANQGSVAPQGNNQTAQPQQQQKVSQPIPGQQFPQVPYAQSRSTPTISANSKELLSVLKGGPLKKEPIQVTASNQREETHSRAGEFLQMLNRKPESSSSGTDTPKKIFRREKGSLESDASATLLGLLGKKPSTPQQPKQVVAEPKSQSSSSASAELLGLINKLPSKTSEQAQAPQTEADVNAVPKNKNHNASAELLGLINRKPAKEEANRPIVEELEPRPIAHPSEFLKMLNGHKPHEEDKNASGELLDILNQPKKAVRIAKRDEGSPADLKSVLGDQNTRSHSAEANHANLILSTLNRKSAIPQLEKITSKPTPPPEDFEEFENFEDFDDLDEISASQNDIYNSIANTFDVESEEEFEHALEPSRPVASSSTKSTGDQAGNHLLLLLNGGRPPVSPGNFQDTYGNPEQSSTSLTPSSQHHNIPSNNGADLLRVLGRRPPAGESNSSSDGRSELLSILKGPRS